MMNKKKLMQIISIVLTFLILIGQVKLTVAFAVISSSQGGDFMNEGELLFEDDCSDFMAKSWGLSSSDPASAGKPVYSVDAKGNSNNPTTPNKRTAPDGQYLVFCEGQNQDTFQTFITKSISATNESWTLELKARFADLVKTKAANATDGKDPWNGFRVEMYANKRQWRVNFTQGDKILMLDPGNSSPTEPVIEYNLLDDKFHTYTLHYDGNGNLKIGVDGILLGSYSNPGKVVTSENISIQFHNVNVGSWWESGNNEVYLDHIALYGDREDMLKAVYTITYDANGGSGAMANGNVIHGENYTIPANVFIKDGYTFVGWTASGNKNDTYEDEDYITNVTGNLTLTANWKENPDAEWEALRQSAKDRQRRVIFDNDGDDAAAFPKTQTPSMEKILAARTSFLNKYPVDTINYSITRGGFDYLTTRTRVGELAYAEGVDPNTYNYQILTKWLHEQNTDALTLQMNYARENNMEIFACLRVNDGLHDWPEAPGNPHPMFSPFKRQHPELLLGTNLNTPDGTNNGSAFGKWSGYNFAEKAVRDRFYAVVDEVLTDYASASDGLDGISFDFHRESLLFKSAAQGKDVTVEERNALTELFRRIRTRAEEIGKQRGRPILIAVKLPDSVDYCMNAGINLDAWMEGSLIDLVVGGSHVEPWGNMVELCHSKNVKYYASLEGELHSTENLAPKAFKRNIFDRYWAQMLAAMKAGVDGIQYFNLVQEFEVQEIMSLNEEALAYKPKRIFPTNQLDAYQEYWLKNGGAYSTELPRLTVESPVLVLSGKETELYLEVGDDLKAAEEAGEPVKVTVAVYGKIDNPQDLIMITGGKQATYQNSTLENIHYYTLPIEALSIGVNRISLTMPANGVDGETKDIILKGDTLLSGDNQLSWRRMMYGNPGGSPKNEEIINGTYCITDVGAKSRPNLHYSLAQQVGGYTGENPFLANFSCKVESATDERSVVFYVADGSYVTEVSLMHGKVSFLGTDASYSMDTTDKMHSYQLKITNTKAFLYVDGGSQPILETLLLENRKVFSKGMMFTDTTHAIGNANKNGLLFGSLSYNGASKAYWQNIEIVRPQNSAWINDLNLQISYGIPDPKGKLLFEDDCSDFTVKGWNFPVLEATSVGKPVYSVDANDNSNNPTTPNKRTAPDGQYLAFCEGQNAVNHKTSVFKVISGIEESWTLEFRARFADLVKSKADKAPNGEDPWNGFRVEMNANKRLWRVNFTQGDKAVMLDPGNSSPTEPVIEYNLIDGEYHTYTLHYDGYGKLMIGVDGMLLGSYINQGKLTNNQTDWIQFFNENYGDWWQSGNNEVYMDYVAVYTSGDPGFNNEGELLFEDDCSDFTAKKWAMGPIGASVVGKAAYIVDAKGKSNNPTSNITVTPPTGQYLVYHEGGNEPDVIKSSTSISQIIPDIPNNWSL